MWPTQPAVACWSPTCPTIAWRRCRTTPQFRFGAPVRAMVANPYREHLYVASRDSLAVIGSMHRVVARIPLTGDPNNIMIDRDGNRVFVTNYDGSIAVINTENHSIDTFPASGIQTWWSAPAAHSSSLRTTQPSATTFRIGIERSARRVTTASS